MGKGVIGIVDVINYFCEMIGNVLYFGIGIDLVWFVFFIEVGN